MISEEIISADPMETMKRFMVMDKRGLPPEFNILGFVTEKATMNKTREEMEMVIISWRESKQGYRQALFSFEKGKGWIYEGEYFAMK